MALSPEGQLHIVVNPSATRAPEIQQDVLNPLTSSEWASAISILPTRSGDFDTNVDMLAAQIDDGDTVVACGGDGMASIVGNAVILAQSDAKAEGVSAVFTPHGRANDIARSINGRDSVNILDILASGSRLPRDTIHFHFDVTPAHDLSPGEGPSDRHALAYGAFGATALASRVVDDPAYRERRAASHHPDWLDQSTIFKTTFAHRPFSFKDVRNPFLQQEHNPDEQNAHELMFWTSVAASIGGNALEHDGTNVMRSRKIGPHLLPANFLLKMMTEVPSGGLRGKAAETQELLFVSSALVHTDGEVQRVPLGTQVTVEHYPISYHTLSIEPSARQ